MRMDLWRVYYRTGASVAPLQWKALFFIPLRFKNKHAKVFTIRQAFAGGDANSQCLLSVSSAALHRVRPCKACSGADGGWMILAQHLLARR